MTLLRNVMTQPHQLQWWQWGQLLGLSLPLLFLYPGTLHPLLWAFALHFFLDFTVQSDETAAAKARRNWPVLLCHAFISGGYAGLIVGGIAGLAISAIIHFLIDTTNKLGLPGLTGAIVDQAAHLTTLLLIWWLL